MIKCILAITPEESELWTAIGTFALAGITFVAIGVQIYWNRKVLRESRSSFSSQLNLLQSQLKDENENSFKYNSIKLGQMFDSQFIGLTEDRKKSAGLILRNDFLAHDTINYAPIKEKMDEIYDFFDTIGYFVKHNYFKAEVAHQYFDYWFSPYYTFFATYHIKEFSGYDETVWNNLSSLSQHMDRVEIDQTGRARKPITKEDLKEFFQQEENI